MTLYITIAFLVGLGVGYFISIRLMFYLAFMDVVKEKRADMASRMGVTKNGYAPYGCKPPPPPSSPPKNVQCPGCGPL